MTEASALVFEMRSQKLDISGRRGNREGPEVALHKDRY